MSGWSELVTTALLGTGRRPLPAVLPSAWAVSDVLGADRAGRDPAHRVLDLAARHRAWQRAAQPPLAPAELGEPAPAPPSDRPPAPEQAAAVLAGLLVRPLPPLINYWLSAADRAGCGVPAAAWTRLARLAAHASAYDRPLLGRVLGELGRWFLRQNPEWRKLAADCALAQLDAPATRAPQPVPTRELLRARPHAIFEHPDPWPADVVALAYAVLGRGGPDRSARDFAATVGARLPSELYAGIASAAEYYLEAPDASPALRRQIRTNFVLVEEAAFARAHIELAFTPADAGAELRRIEIPRV